MAFKTRKTKTGTDVTICGNRIFIEDVMQCELGTDSAIDFLDHKSIVAIRIIDDGTDYGEEVWDGSSNWVKLEVNMGYTLRKEVRSGKPTWYAYRRSSGKLHKRYVGGSENITLQKIRDIAIALPN
jgi:hypothetical protein